MTLIVLNMLIAIIMDAYAEVKYGAESSESLFNQTVELVQRKTSALQGKTLTHSRILSQYLVCAGQKATKGEARIFLDGLCGKLPELKREQGSKELCNSLHKWALTNTDPLTLDDVASSFSDISLEMLDLRADMD